MKKLNRDDVKIESTNKLHNGFTKLVKYEVKTTLFNGNTSKSFFRECLERIPAVGVIPYDVEQDKIVFIEQFRIGALQDKTSPWLLEFVAGLVDKDNEDITSVAKRELLEETGIHSDQIYHIFDYWVSPGGTNEKLYLFWANVDSKKAKQNAGILEENEDIKVHIYNLDDALRSLEKGEINNSITVIGLQWLQLNRDKIRKKFLVK